MLTAPVPKCMFQEYSKAGDAYRAALEVRQQLLVGAQGAEVAVTAGNIRQVRQSSSGWAGLGWNKRGTEQQRLSSAAWQACIGGPLVCTGAPLCLPYYCSWAVNCG